MMRVSLRNGLLLGVGRGGKRDTDHDAGHFQIREYFNLFISGTDSSFYLQCCKKGWNGTKAHTG
jgi:hypothetical protein